MSDITEKKETTYFDEIPPTAVKTLVEKMGWKIKPYVDNTPLVDRRAIKR